MKLARILLSVLLVAASLAYAQDAKVELLTLDETIRAQHAYNDLQKAQEELAGVKELIKAKHLLAGPKDSYSSCLTAIFGDTHGNEHIKSGWGCGEFDFSADFKAIVPHTDTAPSTFSNGCITLRPAGLRSRLRCPG